MKILSLTVLACCVASLCSARSLTLAPIFSDHMVLQREQPVPVWGSAAPGSSLTIEFAGQTQTGRADAGGRWRVDLDPLSASSVPQTLTVRSEEAGRQESIMLRDVLVGEVWLCSGQSNMQWAMSRTENAEAAIAAADHPRIRFFRTPVVFSRIPLDSVDGKWEVCSPETAGPLSGVAYYFARELQRELDVPIGLLQSAWGGTRIEPWTPPEGFEGIESLQSIHQIATNMPELDGDPQQERQTPTAIFNAMIHPHIPFAIRGVIWYQGESNRTEGMLYVDKTRALLNGWRGRWGFDFPFYFVQITPFQYAQQDPMILPEFWEAQAAIPRQIPGTAMAVASDATTLDDIHPPNKEVPGVRLALLALNHTYGRDVVSSGPIFRSISRDRSGSRLRVEFDFADGLTTRDGNPPDWFEIAGNDGVFKAATASIQGSSVLLESDEVPLPVAMRFAWHKLAVPNLMNSAGLPAPAFRASLTDPDRT